MSSVVANVLLLYADTVLSLAEVDHLFASIAVSAYSYHGYNVHFSSNIPLIRDTNDDESK